MRRLRTALERLRELRDVEQEAFVSDFRVYGLAERYLLLAVEACLQACNVLVASLGLRRPEGYHDLLSIVAAQNLIPRLLAYRLEPLTDLREPLLSEPDTLDHAALYDHLRQHLSALEEFAEEMDKLCNESA